MLAMFITISLQHLKKRRKNVLTVHGSSVRAVIIIFLNLKLPVFSVVHSLS